MTGAGTAIALGRVFVLGLGVTGRAMAEALVRRGSEVVVTDDRLGDAGEAVATAIGATWVDPPVDWPAAVAGFDGVLPSPGVPEAHPIFEAASEAGVPVRSELDLAATWDQRPWVLITGTNGKTTVTTLVTEMLQASGVAAVPAGNVEVPLVTAIDDASIEVFVVEASSFRLTFATQHHPVAATWLNFAPDHLDVHLDLAGYQRAKARVWANHADGGLAVVNVDDPIVAAAAPHGDRVETFGLDHPADWHVDDGWLCGPDGLRLLAVDDLTRALPHDLANALAAAATARPAGATVEGMRQALRHFQSLPHRVELVGKARGVTWYDDSKATAPHATVAALRGFPSAVLIAGGRNKGIDLGGLAELAPNLRAVVAIGEAAPDVADAFDGLVTVTTATSMPDAVTAAAALAEAGDAVVLSPACASFDWYSSYAERGDDFQRHVRSLLEAP